MSSLAVYDKPSAILTFDLVISESYDNPKMVPTHPVEDGANVSDSIVELPKTMVVVGRVTESPSDLVPLGEAGPARVKAAIAWFEENATEVVYYQSDRYGLVESLAMMNPRWVVHGQGLHVDFTVQLRQITIANSLLVPIPIPSAEPGAAESKDTGPQPGAEASAAEDAKAKSVALGLLQGVGLL